MLPLVENKLMSPVYVRKTILPIELDIFTLLEAIALNVPDELFVNRVTPDVLPYISSEEFPNWILLDVDKPELFGCNIKLPLVTVKNTFLFEVIIKSPDVFDDIL
jgi:hypothetical protein